MGGVVGRNVGPVLREVQQLWVHKAYRRKGVGTRLMCDLHRRAEGRGCRTSYRETMSFQAPRLYRALGYQTRIEIGGFGHGITKHYMARELAGEHCDLTRRCGGRSWRLNFSWFESRRDAVWPLIAIT